MLCVLRTDPDVRTPVPNSIPGNIIRENRISSDTSVSAFVDLAYDVHDPKTL